jgi:hypothetical protein
MGTNRKLLMLKLVASFREAIQPETVAVYLDYLAKYPDKTLEFAIDYCIREKEKFPSIAELIKACNEKNSADRTWMADTSFKQLEDKARIEPKFYSRLGVKDTPEAKAARIRFLRSRPTVLARYSDKDNAI